MAAAECDWTGWGWLWPCLGWPWAFPIFQYILLIVSLASVCAMFCVLKGIDSQLTAHCRALSICTLCGCAFVCVYYAAVFLLGIGQRTWTWFIFGSYLFNLVLWTLVLALQWLTEEIKKKTTQVAASKQPVVAEATAAAATAAIGEKEGILLTGRL